MGKFQERIVLFIRGSNPEIKVLNALAKYVQHWWIMTDMPEKLIKENIPEL